jgi:hypothetical protein
VVKLKACNFGTLKRGDKFKWDDGEADPGHVLELLDQLIDEFPKLTFSLHIMIP